MKAFTGRDGNDPARSRVPRLAASMRGILLTCALALALAPAAGAQPADHVGPSGPEAVHPVPGDVGYGEWAARYGNFRDGHVHAGQDVFAAAGTPLRAVRDAVVVEKGSGDGRGHYVAIHSAAQRETYVYLHLRRATAVAVGDVVTAGQRIGQLGCTGACFGHHLHFEVRRGRGVGGETEDPLPLLRSLGRPGGPAV